MSFSKDADAVVEAIMSMKLFANHFGSTQEFVGHVRNICELLESGDHGVPKGIRTAFAVALRQTYLNSKTHQP